MKSKWAVALLAAATVSLAQEEPKAPPAHPEAVAKPPAAAHPATPVPPAKTVTPPVKSAAAKSASPASAKPATPAAKTTAAKTNIPAAKSGAPGQAATQPAPSPSSASAANARPDKIRVCDAENAGWCWTYTRNGDHYDGTGEHGGSRSMTLESFNSDSVVMRMTQTGRPGWYSVNSGKMSGNGIQLGDWSDNAGHQGRITASWDAPAQSAPHTNIETAAGLEKRAAATTGRSGPPAKAASPTTAEPPK